MVCPIMKVDLASYGRSGERARQSSDFISLRPRECPNLDLAFLRYLCESFAHLAVEGSCSFPGKSYLTPATPFCTIIVTSSLSISIWAAGLGFHEEWLRDEPFDATATGSGSYILTAGANSLLETGHMRFGMRAFLFCVPSLFSHFPEKEAFAFLGALVARPRLLATDCD